MASSAQNHQQHTSAPPPTPSTTQPNFTSTSDSAATDLLSRLLHRLPPTLSSSPPLLLRRRSSLSVAAITTSPPIIPFSDLKSSLSSTLSSVSELGFFQLTNHSIPSELARSAESDSLSVFNLSRQQKHQHFPRNWPLGFEDDDDEDAGDGDGGSLFLDSSCSTDSPEFSLSSLRDFTREMEIIGLAVVEALSCAMGIPSPGRDDPDGLCSLMWISNGSGSSGDKIVGSGKLYPYVVGLHYQIRTQSCSLMGDSGCVSVSPQTDSILVTLGDIAQVWSNGRLKKVRGKPTLSMEEGNNSSSLLMSLLVTLPLESTVSPLLSRAVICNHGDADHHDNNNQDDNGEMKEEQMFNSFSFEDYAWRVYHERDPHKDSLYRYRI